MVPTNFIESPPGAIRIERIEHCSFASPYAMGQEAEAKAVPAAKPAAKPAPAAALSVTVDLVGGQKVSGVINDLTALPFQLSFGAVEIDLALIAGVKFASSEDSVTTVILNNGDSVTGATTLKQLTVETDWGQAKVNGSTIASILFIPDLKWNATMTMTGKRWNLVDSKNSTPSGSGSSVPNTSSSGTVIPSASGSNLPRPAIQPGRN
jgi:hypothetical protein